MLVAMETVALVATVVVALATETVADMVVVQTTELLTEAHKIKRRKRRLWAWAFLLQCLASGFSCLELLEVVRWMLKARGLAVQFFEYRPRSVGGKFRNSVQGGKMINRYMTGRVMGGYAQRRNMQAVV